MLVKRYYFQAVRTSYLIIQDASQAEDIVQTAFLHASEKIDQLYSDRFGPWFLKMVINASIKAVQKQKRFISLEDQPDEESLFLVDWLLDQRPSVEDMVETEELRTSVWKALQHLTPRQRAVVVMKYFLDMSEKEITQMLQSPLSTIKWQLYTARQKLQTLLKPQKPRSNSHELDSLDDCIKQKE